MARNTNGINYMDIGNQLRNTEREGGINGVIIIPRSAVEKKIRTRKDN